MPGQLEKNMQKALKNLKVSDLTKVREVELPFDKELQKLAETMKKKIQKKEMGGEVMDMTKSEPVSMMEEGGSAISDADRKKVSKVMTKFGFTKTGKEVKMPKDKKTKFGFTKTGKEVKMNMGGVVPGRGGSFKGMR